MSESGNEPDPRPGETREVSAMLMPELRRVAGGLGIKSAGMKKADLVAAIRGAQGGASPAGSADGTPEVRGTTRQRNARRQAGPPAEQPAGQAPVTPGAGKSDAGKSDTAKPDAEKPQDEPSGARSGRRGSTKGEKSEEAAEGKDGGKQQDTQSSGQQSKQQDGRDQAKGRKNSQGGGDDAKQQGKGQGEQESSQGGNQSSGQAGNQAGNDDDEGGSRRNRRRRGRDRQGNQSGNQSSGGQQGNPQGGGRHNRHEPDTTVLDDDVLLPCAGILDVLDNYAFVRTTGYLPGADDVYVSLSMVRKLGLRPGDAISGQVRLPREGERKEKFNPLVKIDSVNGSDPELARSRKEFGSLTPTYPTERLRMETRPDELIGRVLDVAAPVGKGQRGLVVAPARSGRTTVLRAVADAVSQNNPECHLMVVLVDERPEEVTDFERSVKGEVISSTFDRPPSDHTAVAELAIERAKRLVELEHDVVVLLDGVTTLGRAYNLAAPASGRTLAGGVDAAALHPPKRFFGAARNVENGGSLTILATASVETGSAMDEVIFEEFEGTATMELRLRRDLSERWLFPAVDVLRSGTRREELLMGEEELEIVRKLRRAVAELDPQRALEMVLARLGHTRTNYEFLAQVQRATDAELTTTR